MRAQRYERNLALIVFDLDDFKSINDDIGHLAGDRVLSQAAERLRDAVRSVDVACRIGGDEFAVILPESGAEDADQLYRRVHNAMRGTALGPDGQRLRISAGVAELEHGDTAASLFERADGALYRAKDLGKDRVDVARSSGPHRPEPAGRAEPAERGSGDSDRALDDELRPPRRGERPGRRLERDRDDGSGGHGAREWDDDLATREQTR